jgi:spermidine/putrescine transport system substrate-binding protein
MKNKKTLLIISSIIAISLLYFLFYFYNYNTKYISIMAWNNSIDLEIIKKFEDETGIKVHIKYYASNEELISKLSISNKNIDLIFPSDYAIPDLLKLKLIKPIDTKKIECFNLLITDLLSTIYYNKQYYGIPTEWGVFGLVVNKKIKKNINNNNLIYKAFFDGYYKKTKLKLALINDIPTVTNIAYHYYKFFFQKNKIYNKKNLLTILYEILKNQKKQVTLYSDESILSLFSDEIIDISLMQSFKYLQMLEANPSLKLDFILPNYHILRATDYCAISSSSNKNELCYIFINFILKKESLLFNIKQNLFFSPRSDITYDNNLEMKKILMQLEKNKKIIKITEAILNKEDMIALWMNLKS